MKRTGQLTRTTGLQRGGQLARTTPLRPRSPKMRATYVSRARLVAGLLEAKPWCEIQWDNGCQRRTVDVHEPEMRSRGANILDEDACVTTCRHCHDEVHANPAEATVRGFMIPSGPIDKPWEDVAVLHNPFGALIVGLISAVAVAGVQRAIKRSHGRAPARQLLAEAAEARPPADQFVQQAADWPGIHVGEFDADSIPDVPEGLYDGLPVGPDDDHQETQWTQP